MKAAVDAAREQFRRVFGDQALKRATTPSKPQTKEPRRKRRDNE
jgi:hypothetical protein